MFYNKIFFTISAVAAFFLFVESQKICPTYANNNPFAPCAIVNGTCYCVASQKQDDGLFVLWDEANTFCRSANMNLVSIESAEKDREVTNTINNFWSPSYSNGYYVYWTSGRYNYDTALFEWTATGEPLTYVAPRCCGSPATGPCNCTYVLDPNNGDCVINHVHEGVGNFRWATVFHTDTVLPFTCEDRGY